MSVTITPPKERTCELCGRGERWDEEREAWQVADDPGNVYCIHEWDVNGSFIPFKKE
ncbi:HEWD family protein [Halorubrum luteum]